VLFVDQPVLRRRIHGQNLGITKNDQASKDLMHRVRTHYLRTK
jgi:hypothetical protein